MTTMTVDYATQRARWEQERKEREIMAQLEREAAEAKRQRAAGQRELTRATGEQLGFAWHCMAGECDSNGTDRGEYTTHAKSHGAKPLKPSTVKIKLRKAPVAVKLPPLEVPAFKWLTWTQEHTEPGVCECGHPSPTHQAWHGNDGVMWACESCSCRTGGITGSGLPKPTEYSAERRGQYLGNGPHAHSVWVLPFDAAPWEGGRAAPVLLYVSKAGRYFTHAYSAKHDRA